MRLALKAEVSSERTHQCSRQIQPEPCGLSALLKRPEEPLWIRNAAPGIAKADQHTLFVGRGRDREQTRRLAQHCSLAVLGQVEEDLHQTLTVGPHGREAGLDDPLQVDAFVAE